MRVGIPQEPLLPPTALVPSAALDTEVALLLVELAEAAVLAVAVGVDVAAALGVAVLDVAVLDVAVLDVAAADVELVVVLAACVLPVWSTPRMRATVAAPATPVMPMPATVARRSTGGRDDRVVMASLSRRRLSARCRVAVEVLCRPPKRLPGGAGSGLMAR